MIIINLLTACGWYSLSNADINSARMKGPTNDDKYFKLHEILL